MMPYHAYELTRGTQPGSVDCLSMTLFDAGVQSQPGYSTSDREYDAVYVIGDHNLENRRRADQT